MIVRPTELFKHAYGKYAIGAYSPNNLEQIVGLFRGNLGKIDRNDEPVDESVAAPFILQVTRGACSYTDKRFLEAIIRVAEEVFPEAILALHFDYGDEETCYNAIDSGFFTSVMINAGHEPFVRNVEITRRVVEYAHKKGVAVEAEIGMVNWDDMFDFRITSAEDAKMFVTMTDCDFLAVEGLYVSRAAYAFTRPPRLRVDRLASIQQALPEGYPLVVRTGSAVPREWVDRINASGGRCKHAMGFREEDYLTVARFGVCKINMSYDSHLVWSAVYRETFRDKPECFDLRAPGEAFMRAYAEHIIHKNKMLGSAGRLKDLRAILNG